MKFYWRLASVPELAALSKARRNEIHRIYWKVALRSPDVWGFHLVPLSFVPIVHGTILTWVPLLDSFFGWFILVLVALVVPGLALRPFVVQAILPHLLSELGCCPHCGYDLRATPDRCPECGNPAGRG